jgi:uncharacterized membrane protein YjfL (UPF0719 family)
MSSAAPPSTTSPAAPAPAPAAAAEMKDVKIDPARAIARAGALAGAFLVIGAAAGGSGAGEGLRRDLPWMLAFAAAGLAGAALAAALLDRALLRGGLARELARGNPAAGVTAAGHRIATGVVAAGCLYGADLSTLGIGLAFLAIGTATLLAFQLLHRRLTRYADDEEIRGENSAAALGNAGLTIALAVIVSHAAEGSFTGWAASLRGYALALLLALALYPVRQLLVARWILGLPVAMRGRQLDREIAARRNAVVGAVEGLAYLATAVLVTGLL